MTDTFLRILRDHDRFVITTHIRPDGDALGSELAMGRFLTKLGKQVTILNSDTAPYNLGWLPGADDVQIFDGSLDQRTLIDEADVVLVMDVNSQNRLGRINNAVHGARGQKLLIDHHPDPEGWFDAQYARTDVSSTGELVYELIAAYDPDQIDREIATNLYTAIMTDTGSFRYSNTTPAVHRIIADLLERGKISAAPIHTSLFDTRSLEGLRLLGLALETVTLCYGGQVGYIVVSQRMVRKARSGFDETEGFVGYVLSIESVQAALIFLETDSGTKISFRSKGDLAINGWARAFGGGGHPNAAGAYVRRPLQRVIDDVIAAAPRHLDLDFDTGREGMSLADRLSPEDVSYLSSLTDSKPD